MNVNNIKRGQYKGELTRPYMPSPLTIREIMSTGSGRPDPGGVPGARRWDVPGSFRGQGTWQLVIVPNGEVLHFNFVK